jgi:predicted RNase H-like HicB family nuclease
MFFKINSDIFCKYIQAANSKAVYEVIDNEEPYCVEVPKLKGVWATGKTPEECHENLRMAVVDWIAFGLRFNLPIPVIEGQTIKATFEAKKHVKVIPCFVE